MDVAMNPSPLSWIRSDQKGCDTFIYEVCDSWYVRFSVTFHPVGDLSLIHSQEEGPHFASIYPLFATNISLLYGLTTGPCWVTLYPVALSRLSLLFKKLNSLPRSP